MQNHDVIPFYISSRTWKPLKLADFSSIDIFWKVFNVKSSRNIESQSKNNENLWISKILVQSISFGRSCEKFEEHRESVEEKRKPLKLEDFSFNRYLLEGLECEKFEKHRESVEGKWKPLNLEDFSSIDIFWKVLNVKSSRNIENQSKRRWKKPVHQISKNNETL